MDLDDFARQLEQIKHDYYDRSIKFAQTREIRSSMHRLAEAHYLPAQEFFVSGLQDPDVLWREAHLNCLGFHYEIEPQSTIADAIRRVVLEDPSPETRYIAVGIIGQFAKWPEYSLLEVLHNDPSAFVREHAFHHLLGLLWRPLTSVSVSQQAVIEPLKRTPSIDSLKAVLSVIGLPYPEEP